MSRQKLLRWAGLAGVVGGVLVVVTEIVLWAIIGDQPSSVAAASSTFFVTMTLQLLAAYLAFLALIGLYARQATESGGLGLASFVIASLGTALMIGALSAGAFLTPAIAELAPQSLDALEAAPPGTALVGWISVELFFILGWILFGIASLRAKVVPRLAAWLLILAMVVMLVFDFIGLPGSGVVFGVALGWLGWWLWSEKEASSI
jgi:hypothetical protein